MFSGSKRLQVLLFACVALVGVGLGVLAYSTDALRSLELNTVDTRFSVRGQELPRSDLVVVEIDPKSFEAVQSSWPFPHDAHAKVTDRLRRDGAKVIAFDLQFSEPGQNSDAQLLALVDAFERAGNGIVATTEVDPLGNGNGFGYILPPRVANSRKPAAINDFLRQDVGIELGYSSFPPDPGGVLRRMRYETGGLKSFSVAVAERASGRQIDPAALGGQTTWIDYYGPPRTVKHVSYADVWSGRTEPGTFRDKIVVIGATAPSVQDLHPTSTSGDGEMSGSEIQANAIGTALAGFPLRDSPGGLDIALIVILGLVAPVASLRLSGVWALSLALAVGTAFAAFAQLAFNAGTVLPFVYPVCALALSAIGALAVHYVTEAFDRKRTHDLFSRFVPESVVGQVLGESDGHRLGGVAREATVMFSDLRGFTSFAESLEPDQVITILNRYLTAMVDDGIMCHGGTLVDYMGDGILAVFGAPIEMEDHADRALAAARDKLKELGKFNAWLRQEYGFEKSFRMGIGLSSGRVMSGNVGSERRMAYTVIGDTTNTAARLEAMTKGTPYMIFMSDSTRASLSEQPDDLCYVGEREIRGREQKVELWSVGEVADESVPAQASFQSVSGT